MCETTPWCVGRMSGDAGALPGCEVKALMTLEGRGLSWNLSDFQGKALARDAM